MKRLWLYIALPLMMVPFLACNCNLLEALRQGVGLLAREPTAVIPQPTMPVLTSVPQPRPTVPTISLDELDVPLVISNQIAIPRQGALVRSSSVYGCAQQQ